MAEMAPLAKRVRKEIQVRIRFLSSSIVDFSWVEESFWNYPKALAIDKVRDKGRKQFFFSVIHKQPEVNFGLAFWS